MKKLISIILSAAMLFAVALPCVAEDAVKQFSDVPQDSYASSDILALRKLGVSNGMGDGSYGLYSTFKRCDFVLMLSRLMKWDTSNAAVIFDDVPQNHYASGAISAAAKMKIVSQKEKSFRPNDFITRAEMAEMLALALGYGELAENYRPASAPFTDVAVNSETSALRYGAITMAYNFGIIRGTTAGYPTEFNPSGVATREQAAAMMMRFYRCNTEKPKNLHAFYAISGWQQKDYIADTNGISVGWARMEYDDVNGVSLSMTRANENEYYVPDGAQALLDLATVPVNLDIYMDTRFEPMKLLQDEKHRAEAIEKIMAALKTRPAFKGVTIDFEGFISADYRAPFNAFLRELNAQLGKKYKLYCAVPPNDYYKGYDYQAIGEICDKVILMAHDYNSKTLPDYMLSSYPQTPIAPISSVYNSLAEITNPQTGVDDKSKILLGISFGTARWEMKNGKVNPNVKKSDYTAIQTRINNGTATEGYSTKHESPFITYHDQSDNTDNIVWYENSKSIEAKCRMAQMFGIGGISIWRLGIIPENTWQTIANGVS